MNLFRKSFRIMLAILSAAIAIAMIGAGARSSASFESTAAPEPSTQLLVEPILTDFAKKIKACPDFTGSKFPGDTLNIHLSVPPNLNETAQCGIGRTRRPGRPLGRPTRPSAVARATPSAPAARPTPTRTIGRRPRPGTLGTRPGVSGGAAAPGGVDIPCELLPTGCDPIPDTPDPTGGPDTQLKITSVNVKWGVFESVNGSQGRPLVQNKDFASPTQNLDASFIMAPLRFAELANNPNPPTHPYMIVATVQVIADKTILSVPPSTTKVTSAPVSIPVPLSLADLEVPRIFGLFLDLNFGGAAALYLPKNATLNKTTLPDNVRRVADTYKSAASTLKFVTWFGSYLAGLNELNGAFNLPHWDLKELKDREPNLNEDDFIHRSALTSVNDTEVEDEASSMLLIGLPDTSVQFFQHRSYDGMHFTAKTGIEMVVLAPNLITMQTKPTSRVSETTFTSSKTPNNSLSSFKWLR